MEAWRHVSAQKKECSVNETKGTFRKHNTEHFPSMTDGFCAPGPSVSEVMIGFAWQTEGIFV